MAEVVFHRGIAGFRGKIGGLIYRKCGRKTIVYAKPRPSRKGHSRAQQQTREIFRAAVRFANAALKIPEYKEVYAKFARAQNRPILSVMIEDFYHPPEIKKINLAGYRGRKGSRIRVLAKDKFGVTSVSVAIKSRSTGLIEQGEAVCAKPGSQLWTYTARTTVQGRRELTIEATASDRPGNRAIMTENWTSPPSPAS